MDFDLSDAQRERRETILRFATERLSPGAAGRDAAAAFSRALWDEAAAFGLAGLPIPESWGGSGLSPLDTTLAVEALGEGCRDSGLVFSLCAHMFACAVPVWEHGDDVQRARFLPGLAGGELIGANAITEPDAGSDAFALRTSARRDGEGYVLDGTKMYVTNAPVADLFLVYATVDPEKGMLGITPFMVERDTPGLTVAPAEAKTGLRTSPTGAVHLDGCRVPASHRLGAEGRGAMAFQRSMLWERACLFGAYVGAMQHALDRAVEHARERRQFGQPIGRFQHVAGRIVDMRLRLESARLMLYRAAWSMSQGRRCDDLVALAKLSVSEAAVESGLDAIQVFGGLGVMSDTGVDALLRDALPSRIFSGTSEIQKAIVARTMGLG